MSSRLLISEDLEIKMMELKITDDDTWKILKTEKDFPIPSVKTIL